VTGVFQALVVVGLFLLTAVVGVATFVMVRRGHNDNTREQPGVAHPMALTLPSNSGSAREPRDQVGRSDAGAGEQESSDAELDDLRAKAKTLLASAQTARAEAEEESRARRTELRELRADLERREQRLSDREERLDSDVRGLEDKTSQLEELKNDLKNQRRMLVDLETQQQLALERIAGMTAEQAKSELVAAVTHDAKRQAVLVARDIERQATREADARAQTIIVGAIQRLASELTSESVVSAVHLPGDDMKGRIIGREGRNIRAFEQVTGVNVMIDDTPEAVLLSCFDPVRRETARMTLTELVADGRIHPARIEEVHERSKSQIQAQCLRAAEDAMAEVGISDLHPALVPVLGTLRYRTSYGQNVLKHLVESANIAALMAAELGLDIAHCKRAAFLHDIGKALTHEVEGSHAIVGADLARRYGEHADVVHAIEAHHGEVEVRTVEAVLVQAADAISGSRPGARRESIEAYVQRLERLEEIAAARDGVDKVFAMQAGREIRVMVAPEVVDDIEAQVLARDIAKQIEEELTYPGQIKVTVVRESRATETAR
jgi:ribonucrease Y